MELESGKEWSEESSSNWSDNWNKECSSVSSGKAEEDMKDDEDVSVNPFTNKTRLS